MAELGIGNISLAGYGDIMSNTSISQFPEDNTSVIEAAELYTRYKIARWLEQYSTYILTAIALLGNSVSLFTVSCMRPRTSTSIYIAALAVVDTLCLVCKLLTVELVRYPSIPGEFSCGFLFCLFLYMQYAASWLIVIISAERFVAVWFPLKVSLVSTKRKATIILSVLFITLLPLSAWTFWFYQRYSSERWGVVCVVKRRYDEAMEVIGKLHPIIYIVLPFVLILMFNVLIIIGLRQSQVLRKQVHTNGKTSRRGSRRTPKRMTAMLLTTAIVFLLLELMMVILTLFRHYSEKGTEPFVEDFFFVEMAQTLEDTNHAVNFFLYFCSGAKFRETLLRFFRKPTHPRQLTWSSRMNSYKVSRFNSVGGESVQLADVSHNE